MAKELNEVIKNINSKRKLFGEPEVDVEGQKWLIMDHIYTEKSPENLYADGERTPRQARTRKIFLEAAKEQLLEIA